jgi:hypothetical protein
MIQLRERGIYQTPNGQRLVASTRRRVTSDGRRILSQMGSNVCCFLFTTYHWAFHGTPDFEVALQGELIPITQTSGWQIHELTDTGATAGIH